MKIVPQPPQLQAFYDFCNAKPYDLEIDHNGWQNCAVGQFNELNYCSLKEGLIRQVSEVLGPLEPKDSLHWLVAGGYCPNTYGEFTEFLKPYLGIEV